MSFCDIDDINILILLWVNDLKLFIKLSSLNKYSYRLIINIPIYNELVKIKNLSPEYKFDNTYTIDKYYELGSIHILKYLKRHNKDYFSKKCIDLASQYCHVNILDWIINSDFEFRYSKNNIIHASAFGHVHILDWFKNSGLEFEYSFKAIDWASRFGHVNILDWFKNSNLKFKYSSDAIDWASTNGHIHILEWFLNSGLEFKYTDRSIDWASEQGRIDVLNWFGDHNFK